MAADMRETNDLTVGIMAPVAHQEREAIARRTREALGGRKGACGKARPTPGGQGWSCASGDGLCKC